MIFTSIILPQRLVSSELISSDVDTIKTELMLADMATIEKALPRLEKEAKRDKDGAKKVEVAKKVLAGLDEGHRARTLGLDEDGQAVIMEKNLFRTLASISDLKHVAT